MNDIVPPPPAPIERRPHDSFERDVERGTLSTFNEPLRSIPWERLLRQAPSLCLVLDGDTVIEVPRHPYRERMAAAERRRYAVGASGRATSAGLDPNRSGRWF